jgi:hypothetical protein
MPPRLVTFHDCACGATVRVHSTMRLSFGGQGWWIAFCIMQIDSSMSTCTQAPRLWRQPVGGIVPPGSMASANPTEHVLGSHPCVCKLYICSTHVHVFARDCHMERPRRPRCGSSLSSSPAIDCPLHSAGVLCQVAPTIVPSPVHAFRSCSPHPGDAHVVCTCPSLASVFVESTLPLFPHRSKVSLQLRAFFPIFDSKYIS